jgi:hypothetical protein
MINVFVVAKPYDPEFIPDEVFDEKIKNSVLDFIEDEFSIPSTEVNMIEQTEEEYTNIELEEDEFIFVYGPLAVNQFKESQVYIPDKISHTVIYDELNNTTVLDYEEPESWRPRDKTSEELDEMYGDDEEEE